MPSKASPYRPLTSARKGFFRISRLWLASDHVVVADSVLGFESYRRYYLYELEAFILSPTRTGQVWSILLGLSTAGCLLAAALQYQEAARLGLSPQRILSDVILWVMLAVLFLVFFVWNLFAGPTAVMHVQTRSGAQRLRMVQRLRAALKLRNTLLPLILAAQADLTTGIAGAHRPPEGGAAAEPSLPAPTEP